MKMLLSLRTNFLSRDHLDNDSDTEHKKFLGFKKWILQGLTQIKTLLIGEFQRRYEMKLGTFIRPQDSWSIPLGEKELPSNRHPYYIFQIRG